MQIQTTLQFKNALKQGPYAWPGGYPLFFICDDGGALCCKCAASHARPVMEAIRDKARGCGWRVVGEDINWEDPDLYCDNCNDRIESAYAD